MYMNLYLKVLIVQLLLCLLVILTISAMRIFSTNHFEQFVSFYKENARYDTNVSLVYEGN